MVASSATQALPLAPKRDFISQRPVEVCFARLLFDHFTWVEPNRSKMQQEHTSTLAISSRKTEVENEGKRKLPSRLQGLPTLEKYQRGPIISAGRGFSFGPCPPSLAFDESGFLQTSRHMCVVSFFIGSIRHCTADSSKPPWFLQRKVEISPGKICPLLNHLEVRIPFRSYTATPLPEDRRIEQPRRGRPLERKQ